MTTVLFILNLLSIIAALIAVAASRAYNESQRTICRLHGELADTQIQLRDTLEHWHEAKHMGITSTECADCKHETDTCKKLDCYGGLQVCVNDEEDKL